MQKKLHSVLLIDDDEPTNYLNKMTLEEIGCIEEIFIFQSASKALDYLNTSTYCPDLILLDINMPAMNGWEFLDVYEQLPSEKRGKVVIVMLTTSFNPDDRLRAGQIASVSGFMNKPLTKETLKEILVEYF
ncbi:MAG: response regulator [Chitinophagaceae bacterium]|nr:response regulator [Chitinophagaceae bacterium]